MKNWIQISMLLAVTAFASACGEKAVDESQLTSTDNQSASGCTANSPDCQ